MTEHEELKNLLKKLQVSFSEAETQGLGYKDDRIKSTNLVIVAHHNYHFSDDGMFLGVENEDFQEFIPRSA